MLAFEQIVAIVSELNANNVRYVLIGGVAMRLQRVRSPHRRYGHLLRA